MRLLFSSKSDALSSTSSSASNANGFSSFAVVDTLLLSNLAPTFAIGNLSGSTAFAEITKTTFAQAVESSRRFSGKGIFAGLTTLRKALSVARHHSIRSIGQGGDNAVGGGAIVKGLSGGQGHEKKTDSLKGQDYQRPMGFDSLLTTFMVIVRLLVSLKKLMLFERFWPAIYSELEEVWTL